MKKTKKWRGLLLILCVAAVFGALPVSASNEARAHNWYCVHVKDHIQPRAGAELLFVEKDDGYYIDHAHASQEDTDKVIYLTFDAGYENGNVARVLDVLKEESVTAAFFILGNLIEKNTELVSVPSLVGMELSAAVKEAMEYGLNIKISGTDAGNVVYQSLPLGAQVKKGTVIEIRALITNYED